MFTFGKREPINYSVHCQIKGKDQDSRPWKRMTDICWEYEGDLVKEEPQGDSRQFEKQVLGTLEMWKETSRKK